MARKILPGHGLLPTAAGCFCNIFVNLHHGTPAGTDRNISILGRGRAVLDGGEYNGLCEYNSGKDGWPHIWNNSLVLFTNVDGFRVSGLHCRDQRWWALTFVFCAHGYIGDIDFCACDLCRDEQGNFYHGLSWQHYLETYIKNADGIDLRAGCHHIEIENITGFTEDDTIALTGLWGRIEQTFGVQGLPTDIAHVSIRNVRAQSFCTIIRMLNQSGIRLHDITIDGVYDTSQNSTHMDRGLHAVRMGDHHLYGTRQPTLEETTRITIKNVRGKGEHVINLAGRVSDLVMYGIESFDGALLISDEREPD